MYKFFLFSGIFCIYFEWFFLDVWCKLPARFLTRTVFYYWFNLFNYYKVAQIFISCACFASYIFLGICLLNLKIIKFFLTSKFFKICFSMTTMFILNSSKANSFSCWRACSIVPFSILMLIIYAWLCSSAFVFPEI